MNRYFILAFGMVFLSACEPIEKAQEIKEPPTPVQTEKTGVFCAAECDGLKLQCRGNEPAWTIEFNNGDIVWTDHLLFQPSPQIQTGTYNQSVTPISSGTYSFISSIGFEGSVSFDPNNRCQDSMSGEPFDYAITMPVNPYNLTSPALNGCCRIIPD